MASQGSSSRVHALLVGIDEYSHQPLRGCVNDIDAIQRVLLGPRMAVPAAQITRLASPLASSPHAGAATDPPATLAHIRHALEVLGTDHVAPGDRVFIYYSGHGARVEVDAGGGRRFHREALVPSDYDRAGSEPRLLYDFELNQLLSAITARTRAVTVVLDCCHAAGTTRDGGDGPRPRYLDLGKLGWPRRIRDPAVAARAASTGPAGAGPAGAGPADAGPAGAGPAGAGPASAGPASTGPASTGPASAGPASDEAPLARGVEACHVVAACQAHELAHEAVVDGVPHGLLTHALLTAVHAAAERDLHALTWAQIWQSVRVEVQDRNRWQTPWMSGHPARAVFGGPPVDGDAGFAITRLGDAYRIEAGTLAGVTRDAELAIYGERPALFPWLDSADDHAARVGTVLVIDAERESATASARAPFVLPAGARARLVKAGRKARLRYATIPADSALDAALAKSPLLERAVPPSQPDVRLERVDDRWFITDDVAGRPGERVTLFALPPSELDRARAVLEHYDAYARPLRMAAAIDDLPGGLALEVLVCPEQRLSPAQAQAASALCEASSPASGTYELSAGDCVCFRVTNRSRHRLRVTLVNSAASGRVQLLGDQDIDAGMQQVFWANNELGVPFHMEPPAGVDRCLDRCLDRLVALGRTDRRVDLDHLRNDRSFADVVRQAYSPGVTRDIGDQPRALSRWAAAQAVIITTAR